MSKKTVNMIWALIAVLLCLVTIGIVHSQVGGDPDVPLLQVIVLTVIIILAVMGVMALIFGIVYFKKEKNKNK